MKLRTNSVRYLVVIMIGIAVSSLFPKIAIDIKIAKLLFGVAGVLFPVSLAVVTSMDLFRVKNSEIRKKIRHNLRDLRNGLSFHFIMAMLSLIIIYLAPDRINIIGGISINIPIIVSLVICESILYMILTFTGTQKLREDIEDRLDEEDRRKG